MGTGKQRSTFISYSRHNKDFAVRLARELKASGFSVWLDQLDIPPGSRWDDELEIALERSEIFMVILTPASMASDNVKDEIGYAIDNRKRILPVLLENATIPLRLRRFQYVDFTAKGFEEGVHAAKELLRQLIDEPTVPRMEIPPALQAQANEAAPVTKVEGEQSAKQKAAEDQKLKAEKAEEDRKAKEKIERELATRARVETERKAKEEADRLAAQKAEVDRVAQQKAEQEQLAQVRAESERNAREESERAARLKPSEAANPLPPSSHPQKAAAQSAPAKKPMSRLPLIIGAVAVLGVCAVIGVVALNSLGNRASVVTEEPPVVIAEDPPTERPAPTEAAPERVATEAPAATEVPVFFPVTGDVHIFFDLFSVNNGAWVENDSRYYQDGYYYVGVADDATFELATSNVAYTDYGPDVIIDVYLASYFDDISPGIYCRQQLNGNGEFYLFYLSDRTSYAIYYFNGSDWEEVTSGSMDLGDQDPFNMRAECVGNRLSFFINFNEVATVTDDRLTVAGDLGLYLDSSNPSGASVAIDMFFAYAPFTTPNCMTDSSESIEVQFENQSGADVVAFSSDYDCNAHFWAHFQEGVTSTFFFYVGDPYVFVDSQTGSILFEYIAQEGDTYFLIE